MKFLTLFLFISLQFPTNDRERQMARKGVAFEEGFRLGDAEVAYKRALKKNPLMPEINYNLGNVLYQQERYLEALEQYRQVIINKEASSSLKSKGYYNIGTTLLKLNRITDSKKALEESLKLNPKNTFAKYNLAYLLASEKEGTTKDEVDIKRSNDTGVKSEFNKELDKAQYKEELQQNNMENMFQILDMHERRLMENIKREYKSSSKYRIEKDW
jgi:tetratricopeptide (TPR) repeat protein